MNVQEYIEMMNKDTKSVVRLYNICVESSGRIVGVVWSSDLASKQNGNGWCKIKMSKLIPLDSAKSNGTIESKTHRNKMKQKISLVEARWVCTDGKEFHSHMYDDHKGLQDAIEHQETLEFQESLEF